MVARVRAGLRVPEPGVPGEGRSLRGQWVLKRPGCSTARAGAGSASGRTTRPGRRGSRPGRQAATRRPQAPPGRWRPRPEADVRRGTRRPRPRGAARRWAWRPVPGSHTVAAARQGGPGSADHWLRDLFICIRAGRGARSRRGREGAAAAAEVGQRAGDGPVPGSQVTREGSQAGGRELGPGKGSGIGQPSWSGGKGQGRGTTPPPARRSLQTQGSHCPPHTALLRTHCACDSG